MPSDSDNHLRVVDDHSAGPKVTPEPAPPDSRLLGLSAVGVALGATLIAAAAWWIRRHVRIIIQR